MRYDQYPESTRNAHRTYRLRLLAPEIVDILYFKYLHGIRMRGVRDPEFLERITPTLICLISMAICHGIWAWSIGTYVKPDHFQSQNESVVKKKGVTIEVIPEDGFSEDDEALTADLAAFRDARKDEVIYAQLRGIDSEEEGEKEEEEQELPVAGDCEGGGEEDV
ncbi:uncharacterized protein H6S33_001372 [Morchella sextelata]|uniref:uncharacterized protein n=1 Tax=Morchella sextelata TaxID=1174677 RepID=UPI001D0469D5|nr:uncharacterized protein H6S33_001372 [Morchella sextelata]KAH0609144.1 hypothetical protein H6S33_001372 [Morchella sextelata]